MYAIKVKYMFYLRVRFLDIQDTKIRVVYCLVFRYSKIYANTKTEIFIYGALLLSKFNE